MKKIIASLAIMAMAVMGVHAQQTDKPVAQQHQWQHGHRGHDMLTKKLNFSDQQKEQLKNINSDYHKKLMDLKKNEDITVRESKAQMNALRTEHHTQLQALLTQDQKDQLAKMKQEHMQKAKSNATARAAKVKEKLGLSDAQAAQLKNNRTEMMTKIKVIHADSSLSREQKHEQVKALAMQQKDQLKTILTPDQLQQLEQMKLQRHRRDFSK